MFILFIKEQKLPKPQDHKKQYGPNKTRAPSAKTKDASFEPLQTTGPESPHLY